MSEANYGLGFYLIETEDSYYNLYNSITDKCILEAQPKERIVSFLELNLPTHPFLYQLDQDTEYNYNYTSSYNPSAYATSLYDTTYNYNYNYSDYESGLLDEDMEERYDPVQLEFEFTYGEDNKNKINDSVIHPLDEEDMPYLPDYED